MSTSTPQPNATTTSVSSYTLPPYKHTFLTTCLTNSILRFGTFTLKSGRISPYFFNAGSFNTSTLLSSLATAYAQTILTNLPPSSSSSSQLFFDTIFGPAYKGIPLAAVTCLKLGEISLTSHNGLSNVSYCFNRKEAKDHGEGGTLVGLSDLTGKRVLIVDDVITAGTAIREAIKLITDLGGEVVGIVVALDRMETMTGKEETGRSAIAEVKREFGVQVWSIISLDDLIGGVGIHGIGEEERERMREYRAMYGARDV